MADEQIDFSDLLEVPPEKFAQAIVRKGLKPVAWSKLLKGASKHSPV